MQGTGGAKQAFGETEQENRAHNFPVSEIPVKLPQSGLGHWRECRRVDHRNETESPGPNPHTDGLLLAPGAEERGLCDKQGWTAAFLRAEGPTWTTTSSTKMNSTRAKERSGGQEQYKSYNKRGCQVFGHSIDTVSSVRLQRHK